ncbi:nucleoside recognition family protein [Thauera sp. 2A1]|uniref:nucleoside recognition family protein n=1 Tax=Thauera sp. 2A1 TaxID=2570191 RepID=UPI0012924ED7|nr:nucleoside recognition family protein [Thauera sp. 2A1]KAI5916910.1 nucleoside recognition family protein [Thauera sp. 2A1]
MDLMTQTILQAGRSAIELALFVLLPIMVVMLTLMRLLEARGVLDWIVVRLTPLLRPAGLTGLGVFAALQVNFVSFAAPVATLTMMEGRGASDRHLAATLAMVMAMAQANVTFPMAAMGLAFGPALALSAIGGLIAAAATYHGFGRSLSAEEGRLDETLQHRVADDAKGVLDVINRAGAEAFKIAVSAIPMLVIALVVVMVLRASGAIDALTAALTPLLSALGIHPAMVLLTLTKTIAGGTAMMGVMEGMLKDGTASVAMLNANAGFLIHPLDVGGVAVLISAGRRVASVWKPAALGAMLGILVRMAGHALL